MSTTTARKRNTLYGSGRTVRGPAGRFSDMARASDGPELPFAVPVGHERVRETHRSALRLMVFEERREGAREGQSGGVQRMNVLRLAVRRPKSDSRAPGLEVLKIVAGGHLEPAPLAWRPRFQVVAFGSGEAQVPRRQEHDPVGQLERVQNRFRVGEQLLVLVVGCL